MEPESPPSLISRRENAAPLGGRGAPIISIACSRWKDMSSGTLEPGHFVQFLLRYAQAWRRQVGIAVRVARSAIEQYRGEKSDGAHGNANRYEAWRGDEKVHVQ